MSSLASSELVLTDGATSPVATFGVQ